MSKIKRITISYDETDKDFTSFVNGQSNASLSLRILCKLWTQKHSSNDIVEYLTTHSLTSNNGHTIDSDSHSEDVDDLGDDFNNLS